MFNSCAMIKFIGFYITQFSVDSQDESEWEKIKKQNTKKLHNFPKK